MLAGDFSAVPLTLAAPFTTINGKPNQVDPSLFSHGAVALSQLLPLGIAPSTGQVNVVEPVAHYTYDENTDRVDYALSQSQHITVRSFYLSYNQPSETTPGNVLAFSDGANGKYFTNLSAIPGQSVRRW